MRHKFIAFFLIGVMLGVAPFGFADEPQIVARLNKQTAQINEEVHLDIQITGVHGRIQAPVLPALEAFEIIYSGRHNRFSIVNGRSESLTKFNYVLLPRTVGRFVIQPIEVELDGKIYRTEQLELTIEGSRVAAIQPTQSATPTSVTRLPLPAAPITSPPTATPTQSTSPQTLVTSGDADENIFLKATPSSTFVYPNEQLMLNYTLYTRYDTRYEGFETEPETSGFWIEEFPMDYKMIGQDSEYISGKKYLKAEVKKLALFPTAPGNYVIKPGVIKTSVEIQEHTSSVFDQFFSDSFFSGAGLFTRRATKFLTAPPINVIVKPLPEQGKPASFKGAVGDFRMSTEVDKRVINQNEAVTLSITIEGQGNIETLSIPDIPEPADTKVYESDTQSQLYRQQNVVAGSKTFEMIAIPQEAGELFIDQIEFSYFNPRSERYVTLKSESHKIQVNPSKAKPVAIPKGIAEEQLNPEKKAIKLESEDIHYLKESLTSERAFQVGMILPWLAVANGVLTLIAIGIGVMQQRTSYLDRNVPLKRTLLAKKYAREGLTKLSRLSRASDHDPKEITAFFDQSAKILNQYLSGKLNLSTHGMTLAVIEQELTTRRADSKTIARIRECYELCDQVRFGQMELGAEKRKEMVANIRRIIGEMERK